MTFSEANTVEAFVRDLLCGGITHHTAVGPGLARCFGQVSGLGWHYLSHENLPRQPQEALVEEHLREALIRLNPDISAQPDRADDVLYRLRAIIMVHAILGPDLVRTRAYPIGRSTEQRACYGCSSMTTRARRPGSGRSPASPAGMPPTESM